MNDFTIKDLTDIPTLQPVPEGVYQIRIKSTKGKYAKTGRPQILLVLEIVGEEHADNFFHTLNLVQASDDKSSASVMYRILKEFNESIGMPTDQDVTPDMYIDMEFEANVLLPELSKEDIAAGRKQRNELGRILGS